MISVTMSSNEAGSKRAAGLALALADDPRFEWKGYEQIPVDLQFSLGDACFNTELKEVSDYIASALGPSGHLYQQVLTMRELGHPCMVLVLGSDEDITNAIKDATKTRYKGQERQYQIGSYNDRLINLESNSEALGVHVVRWKASPWKRLLSLVHKTLTGGNLTSYRGKPANGERALVATAMLLGNGIGCKVLEPVMDHYDLMLVPKGEPVPVVSLPGIGNKRAETINKRIYGVEA